MISKPRSRRMGQEFKLTEKEKNGTSRAVEKGSSFAKQGMTQKEIAGELGFKTPFTLNFRLVRASQATGKPVPAFKSAKKNRAARQVEVVEVRRRGKGEAFGVNIPQEPLIRAGAKPGSRFSVKASKGRIVLTVQ